MRMSESATSEGPTPPDVTPAGRSSLLPGKNRYATIGPIERMGRNKSSLLLCHQTGPALKATQVGNGTQGVSRWNSMGETCWSKSVEFDGGNMLPRVKQLQRLFTLHFSGSAKELGTRLLLVSIPIEQIAPKEFKLVVCH